MTKLAERLRLLRRKFQYTQGQLGQLIGVSNTTISNYEQGNCLPEVSLLIRLAELLQVSTDYLLGLTDDERAQNNPNLVTVPLLNKLEKSTPLFSSDNIFTYINFPKSSLKGSGIFAVYAPDDSLSSCHIYKNTLLFVSSQLPVEYGQYGLFFLSEKKWVCRRYFHTHKTIMLMPESSDPSFLPYTCGTKHPFQQIGRIVAISPSFPLEPKQDLLAVT